MRWTLAVPLLLGLLGCDINISGNNISGNNLDANIDASGNKIDVGNNNGNTNNNTTVNPTPKPANPTGLQLDTPFPQVIYRLPEGANLSTGVGATGDPAKQASAQQDGVPILDLNMHQGVSAVVTFDNGDRKPAANLPDLVDFQLPPGIKFVRYPSADGRNVLTYFYADSTAATGDVTLKLVYKPKPELSKQATASVSEDGVGALIFK